MRSERTTPNSGDTRTAIAKRGVETAKRHKEERRADRLGEMRAQIADGSLVVRQMTAAERKTATQAASRTLQQNQARRR